jgi:hypothetical protein
VLSVLKGFVRANSDVNAMESSSVSCLNLPLRPSFLLLTLGLPQPNQTWPPQRHPLWFSTETAVKFYGERMGHALAR